MNNLHSSKGLGQVEQSTTKELAIPSAISYAEEVLKTTFLLVTDLTQRLKVVSRVEPSCDKSECPPEPISYTVQESIRKLANDSTRINNQLQELLRLLEV